MMPSYQPTVTVDGARVAVTVRNVHGEQLEVLIDRWTAIQLTKTLMETLMEAGR